ncbi:hypothetical protein [Crateriforma conspicua]|uniref:Head-tail adaptor protein n=1 Tax=Crateriforma conspicua TaxID=2527996 RepID=A0A5C6FVS5_9PLAN|nr:hypothetical protein [Crateriforma conspicua]TWU66456.1 hypothetical protein V7x_20220 [Crateriforma conspicua]
MGRLGGGFRRIARASQRLHGDTGVLRVEPPGAVHTSVDLDAVAYKERVVWRRDDGDRYQVITRRFVLHQAAADVPVESHVRFDDTDYFVERTVKSAASGSTTLHCIRYESASVSRPGFYGN